MRLPQSLQRAMAAEAEAAREARAKVVMMMIIMMMICRDKDNDDDAGIEFALSKSKVQYLVDFHDDAFLHVEPLMILQFRMMLFSVMLLLPGDVFLTCLTISRGGKVMVPSVVNTGKFPLHISMVNLEMKCMKNEQVIAAEGEQKSSKALKEASDIISTSPAALQLRLTP